jgi:hypothetical protein
MSALLDASFLIALFDAAHTHHQAAHQWFAANRAQGWATCPLTQNARIRIISQPSYPHCLPVAEIARRLRSAIAANDHVFWVDEVSLTDASLFDLTRVLTPRYLTDVYLLALAAKHDGRFVTFDKSILKDAVLTAEGRHLVVL